VQKHTFSISSIDDLPNLAKQIISLYSSKKIFLFYAEMGAGKTTLIKALCKELGSIDQFTSPTYSVVNEYKSIHQPLSIFHIDLYRLNDLNEALDIGIEEYINGTDYCFIEWPELVEPLLPDGCVRVEIKTDGNNREITIFIS
jgi:tRNA threonylcarbamoyladenosine biosynthesis protein TsaE